jgi:Na+/H+-dicarboxylate symporter
MVGLAMLVLAMRVSSVFSLVEQRSSIVQTLMTGLSSMLPALIFVLFTGMISSGNFRDILGSWKMLVVILLLMFVYSVINLLRVAITKKISPVLLFKKTWPTRIIALTTASSAAAFSTNIRDANKKLGIDKKLVEFGVPIGQVLFKPGYIAVLFGMEATFAEMCDIQITLPWLIIGLITNILVSCASPPVPGGLITGFTVAFTQLGIPLEVLGIAIAVSTLTEFPATSCIVSNWQINLIDVAEELNMLDKETLHKDER